DVLHARLLGERLGPVGVERLGGRAQLALEVGVGLLRGAVLDELRLALAEPVRRAAAAAGERAEVDPRLVADERDEQRDEHGADPAARDHRAATAASTLTDPSALERATFLERHRSNATAGSTPGRPGRLVTRASPAQWGGARAAAPVESTRPGRRGARPRPHDERRPTGRASDVVGHRTTREDPPVITAHGVELRVGARV